MFLVSRPTSPSPISLLSVQLLCSSSCQTVDHTLPTPHWEATDAVIGFLLNCVKVTVGNVNHRQIIIENARILFLFRSERINCRSFLQNLRSVIRLRTACLSITYHLTGIKTFYYLLANVHRKCLMLRFGSLLCIQHGFLHLSLVFFFFILQKGTARTR